MIDPNLRDRRSLKWKRWERSGAMELWQMDVVGGFPLADRTSAKALTGVDDHSRTCVSARLMTRERTRAVCDGLRAALATYGVPEQILTDNGKVLTAPRSPTTTGKIERFHRSLRAEFLSSRAAFTNLKVAQRALDEWVDFYNTTTNGVVCVSWQHVSRGQHYAGSRCDVHVDGDLLGFYIGDDLVKIFSRAFGRGTSIARVSVVGVRGWPCQCVTVAIASFVSQSRPASSNFIASSAWSMMPGL